MEGLTPSDLETQGQESILGVTPFHSVLECRGGNPGEAPITALSECVIFGLSTTNDEEVNVTQTRLNQDLQ